MKKILFLILMFTLVSGSFANSGVSRRVPRDAMMYCETSRVKQLVRTINKMLNLLPQKQKQEVLSERNEFMQSTGIDFLNVASLKKAGIDVSRRIGIAVFRKRRHRDQYLFALPVYNEKTFPLKFAKMLNNLGKKNRRDKVENYPVITSYKNGKIFQFWRDVFGTTTGDYFIITSGGDLVKRIIDVTSVNRSLYSDSNFRNFYRNMKKTNAINVFIKKELLKSEYRREPMVEAVDYIGFGAALISNVMRINGTMKFNTRNAEARKIMRSIKTGLAQRSLYVPNVDTFGFLSFDLKYFEKVCKNFGAGCAEYSQMKQILQAQYGVDLSRHVIPNFKGYVSTMLDSPRKTMMQMNNVTFIAMKSGSKARLVWNKMRNHLKQFAKNKRFGSVRIGGRPGFWILDEKMAKNFITYNPKGIFIGNNISLLKKAMRNRTVRSAGKAVRKRMDKNTYFMLYIKKESFLGAMLMMQAQRDPELQALVNKLQSLFLTGRKNGKRISVDLDVILSR